MKLIDKQGREHFKGKTRDQINNIVGNEHRQAATLSQLHEVPSEPNRFPLSQIARMPIK